LQIEDDNVLVLTDDTDILCLLIHHVSISHNQHDIYIKNITRKNMNTGRICYRIHDVIDKLDRVIVKFILFAHAVTGCDTTSAIHNFGKQAIFPKLASFKALQGIAEQFFVDTRSLDSIGNAIIGFFEELNSPGCSLQQIRK
jgi:5'-3' exonuclease